MPILAKHFFGINIADNHTIEQIVLDTLINNSCFNKNELAEQFNIKHPKLEQTLTHLASFGLITCSKERCCIDENYLSSLSEKLKKMAG